MRYPRPEKDIHTLSDVVELYDTPTDERDPEAALLILADTFRLVHPEGGASMASVFETIRGEVDAIAEKLKAILEAALGPVIGGEAQKEMRVLDEQIRLCEGRIRMAEETADPGQRYDALLASGWKTNISREEWIADELEQRMVAMAERWKIGQLENKRRKIEALFDRFVTKDGTLGNADHR